MAEPLVSIVITSYNYEACVGDAIRSALNQTYKNIEIVVLDNASTDGSLKVINSFEDSRVRVIARTENIGIQRNHNEGIREAKGDFLLFLSADDMLLPNLVADSLAYRYAHPEVDIVYSSVAITDSAGNVIEYFDHQSFDGAESYRHRNEFANLLTRDSCMYLPTTLFPREIFETLGYLDEELEIVLDYEFDIRMASAGRRFAFFATPGALIRFHGDNRSGVKNFVATGKQLREFCIILERYTQPRFHQALAGYRTELRRMLETKVREIRVPFPQEFEERRAELDPLVERAGISIATVPEVGDAVRRGEGLVSVIIPFNGRIGALDRALRSLAAQSYQNWEAIVACDTTAFDPTDAIASLGIGDRVRVSRMRSMRGVSAARNLAAHGVRGEIVAYLDDDNRFESGYLQVLAEAFADPAVEVTCGRFRYAAVDRSGHFRSLGPFASQLEADGGVSRIVNRVSLNAVAHRRSCFGHVGYFHMGFGVLEDWEFLVRLTKQYSIREIDADACTVCLGLEPNSSHLFGQSDVTRWSEYAARLQDMYNAYPPRTEVEKTGRISYASELRSCVNAMLGARTPDQRIAGVMNLTGWKVRELAAT